MCLELNFIHWIKIHLLEKGIDLSELGSGKLSARGHEKVWHWTPGAAREIFSDRSTKAGFEKGLFSYHSPRAGFLC